MPAATGVDTTGADLLTLRPDDGIVVVVEGQRGNSAVMSTAASLAILRERLGEDGTTSLVSVLEKTRQEVKDEVMTSSSERFERRLAEECGALRLEMTKGFASLEVTVMKWSFTFWIGQVVAITGVILTLLKVTGH